jgi:cephalosporin hydroxylase
MTNNPVREFEIQRQSRIDNNSANSQLRESASKFLHWSIASQYSYNFNWLGRPIIQYPQDMVAVQEIIWKVKPDLIIETGIAHGGSLIFSASMLALLEYCEAVELKQVLDPAKPKKKVIGIDIDIRPHNRAEIVAHPLANRIEMVEGSSIATDTVAEVQRLAAPFKKILVCLDSNHTHEHVLKELLAYGPMTSSGSYCIVFDTVVEDLASELIVDRPWKIGDNPKTAVHEFLKDNPEFEIDHSIDSQLLISVAPHGYLRRQ